MKRIKGVYGNIEPRSLFCVPSTENLRAPPKIKNRLFRLRRGLFLHAHWVTLVKGHESTVCYDLAEFIILGTFPQATATADEDDESLPSAPMFGLP